MDITERKKAETRINYLNRVYAVLSGINLLIVRANERKNWITTKRARSRFVRAAFAWR
ncbi:MAG: hypothetical protein IPG06_22565 [Haliea sp.]|nr:hypothetical protein [Haliea sp.]